MTEKKAAANRRNALKSTGPKTTEGKKRASMNALKHGLRSASLAIPHLENPEDWETHRALVVRDLAPVGYLETILSERIAALLWRLGRVVRYESEVVSIAVSTEETDYTGRGTLAELKTALEHQEEAYKTVHRVEALKGKAHVSGEDAASILETWADFLGLDLYPEDGGGRLVVEIPGVPNGQEDYWDDFEGWTRNLVEEGLQALAKLDPDFNPTMDPWIMTGAHAFHKLEEARKAYDAKATKVDIDRRKALLPEDADLEKVTRYETTLERSLFRSLHELQRLQAGRSGVGLLPPATVDMDLSVH